MWEREHMSWWASTLLEFINKPTLLLFPVLEKKLDTAVCVLWNKQKLFSYCFVFPCSLIRNQNCSFGFDLTCLVNQMNSQLDLGYHAYFWSYFNTPLLQINTTYMNSHTLPRDHNLKNTYYNYEISCLPNIVLVLLNEIWKKEIYQIKNKALKSCPESFLPIFLIIFQTVNHLCEVQVFLLTI